MNDATTAATAESAEAVKVEGVAKRPKTTKVNPDSDDATTKKFSALDAAV